MKAARRLHPLNVSLLLSLSALAPSLTGQTQVAALQLDEFTVSATRTERPVNATPGTVNVINLSDAADGVTLDRFLRGEPLVSVPFAFSGAGVAYQRGGASSINIRGVEGNRVLVQVDGVRVPDEFRLGGSEPTGRDYFDPELFERLEILQGSASALYGSDALGGVVTFTTKSPADFLNGRDFFAGAKAAYRSVDDGTSTSATFAAARGSLQTLLVYSHHEGHERENHGTVLPNPEDYGSDAVLAKLVWLPSAPHRFELALENFDRDSTTQVNNKEVASGTATTTALDLVSATQRFRLSAAYLFDGVTPFFDRLEARAYLQDANTTDVAFERIAYIPPSPANGAFRHRNITTSFHNDTAGFSLAAVKSLGTAHRLAYGIEGSRTETAKPWHSIVTNAFGTTAPSEPRMAVTDTDRLGAYVQDEIDFALAGGRTLTLIPGVRLDRFELTPDNSPAYLATTAGQRAPGFDEVAISPKLGVVHSLTANINAYAQYNRGFRYPTAEDLTATFTNPVARYRTVPNPNLKPETSDAFEIGLKGRVARGLTVRLAIFDTHYDEFIEQIAFAPAALQDFVDWPSGTFQTQNRASARIYGAELWSELDFSELSPNLAGLRLTASVGRARGDYDVGGARTRLTTVEPLKAFATLSWHSPRGLGATLSAEHAASGQPGTGTQFTAPSYTILDLAAWWRVSKYLTLRLGLHNLTNERYWRYGSVRGVTIASVSEQQRRTEPGFNATLRAQLSF